MGGGFSSEFPEVFQTFSHDSDASFSLQRDITTLLREVIKNEDSSKWQSKNLNFVKKAIKVGSAELETMYMTLSVSITRSPVTLQKGLQHL